MVPILLRWLKSIMLVTLMIASSPLLFSAIGPAHGIPGLPVSNPGNQWSPYGPMVQNILYHFYSGYNCNPEQNDFQRGRLDVTDCPTPPYLGASYDANPDFLLTPVQLGTTCPPLSSPTPAPPGFGLTTTSGSGGTTSPSPGTYSESPGTVVPITALPSAGFQFDHFSASGPALGTRSRSTILVNMGSDFSVLACFVPVRIAALRSVAGVINQGQFAQGYSNFWTMLDGHQDPTYTPVCQGVAT